MRAKVEKTFTSVSLKRELCEEDFGQVKEAFQKKGICGGKKGENSGTKQSGQWVDIIDHNIDHLQNLPQITVLTKLLDY